MINMRSQFWKICTVVILIVATQSVSHALDIVYPADQTYFGESDYLIIKGGEPPIDGVTIKINGVDSDMIDISSEEYKKYFQDMLILQPDFDAGLNEIEVNGYVDGKKVSGAKAKVFYRPLPTDIPPQGYTRFVMHVESREVMCAPCHDMSPAQDALNEPSSRRNPCASCHARMLQNDHVHGPAGVYECGSCHDASSRPEKYQPLQVNIGELCGDCHDDMLDDFRTKKFVHGPVQSGGCTLCHDAHASAQPAQLRDRVNVVCLACHENVDDYPHVNRSVINAKPHPLEGPVSPRNPQKAFNCSSCHDPHAADVEYYFAGGVRSRLMLCQSCHKK